MLIPYPFKATCICPDVRPGVDNYFTPRISFFKSFLTPLSASCLFDDHGKWWFSHPKKICRAWAINICEVTSDSRRFLPKKDQFSLSQLMFVQSVLMYYATIFGIFVIKSSRWDRLLVLLNRFSSYFFDHYCRGNGFSFVPQKELKKAIRNWKWQ